MPSSSLKSRIQIAMGRIRIMKDADHLNLSCHDAPPFNPVDEDGTHTLSEFGQPPATAAAC